MAEKKKPTQRWLRRGVPIVAVVLVIAAGSVAYAASNGNSASYVTGSVTRADVQQLLQLSGTVTQVKQVSNSFKVSGQVSSVSVSIGDQVTAGQELARLDPKDLQYELLVAEANLAQAQATLASDEAGTSSTSSSGSGTATATTTAYITTAATHSGSSGSSGSLAAAQQAVTQAQQKVAKDNEAVTAAISAALTACTSAPSSSPTTTPSGSATPTPSGSATPTPAPSASATGGSGGLRCAAALAAVQRAQSALTADNQALTSATANLVQVAGDAAKSSSGSSGGGSSTGGSGFSGSGGSSSGGSGGSSSGGSSTPSTGTKSGGTVASGGSTESSAARIAQDQAAVSSAQVDVNDATNNLKAAVLTASLSGTVASVGITAGTTASSSQSITIIASGAARVTVDVPLANLPSVKVGQAAQVTPAGSSVPVDGSVESIGLLPDSSSSTTAYPVTVLVPDADLTLLASGSTAGAGIVLGTVHNVLTVPNSAVTKISSTLATVTVLKGSTATRTRVTLGMTGTWRTQILNGVSAGTSVVLANSSTALPSNSSTSTRVFGTGGGGGFAGAVGGGFTRRG